MASLHAGLNRDLREALSKMAGGSQDDLGTVALASAQLIGAASNTQYQGHVRQLQPCLRLLLQAAGWLYPCFMPSSRLNPIVQAGAQQAWASCMCFVQNILQHQSLTHMPGFLALVQPHTNPQVPGATEWLGTMAGQLPLPAGSGATLIAIQVLAVWHQLVGDWEVRERTPQSALTVLQPGMLRLIERLALQPPPPPAAAGDLGGTLQHALLAAMDAIIGCSGAVVDAGLHPAVKPRYTRLQDSSSSSLVDRPTTEQTVVVLGAEVSWWQGVAALASSIRPPAASSHAAVVCGAAASNNSNPRNGSATTSNGSGSSSRASTGSNTPGSSSSSCNTSAAALCPYYHKRAAWPAGRGAEVQHHVTISICGARSLEFLLLREVQGSLSWVLKQLQPFTPAPRVLGSGWPMFQWPLLVQWPMTPHQLGGPSSSSSSSPGGSGACKCSRPGCHLCTPPTPVNLKQLRLVLEVVCLTCQDTNPEAQQAPVLLALLLQRAAPGVKASFLNSADGTRLLVALQQMGDKPDGTLDTKTSWRLHQHAGALSLWEALNGEGVPYWRASALDRATFLLAWCFCGVDAGANASATAAALATAAASGAAVGAEAPTTSLLTPAAVAHGSVVTVTALSWMHCLHTMEVPSTSLRLAAGLQPSLALFATLEGWLRRGKLDHHHMVMATLLAAVRALLEECGPSGCSCIQACAPSSSTRATGTNGSNNSTSSMPLLPGVMEVLASVAVTVSKLLLKVADKPTGGQSPFTEMVGQREGVVQGADLSNAMLQLALQQVRQEQQPGCLSKEAMCLTEAAHRLLRHAARGAVADMQQQEQRTVTAQTMVRAGPAAREGQPPITTQLAPADRTARSEHLKGTSRLLFELLHTGRTRLLALQTAAAAAWGGGLGKQPAAGAAHATRASSASGAAAGASTVASAGPLVLFGSATLDGRATITPASAAFAAVSGGTSVSGPPEAGVAAWCPVHSSCLEPGAQATAAGMPDLLVAPMITGLNEQIKNVVVMRVPLVGCGNYGCVTAIGPSEAWLVENRPGLLCGGCGVVRYCSAEHALHAWPKHRMVCRQLGAALRRASTTGSDKGSNVTNSNSSSLAAARPDAAGAAALNRPVSASGGGAPNHNSSKDGTTAGDQGPPPGARVCAWCGVAARNLRRCAGCKAAWYCGADHQRAAWKAGHKQECGGSAAPAAPARA